MIWLDAQISPRIAVWLRTELGIEAKSAQELNLLFASDRDIFFAARAADAIVLSKDSDFVQLLELHGPPPKIIWLTCGNTSNKHLQSLLRSHLQTACDMLEGSEALVEVTDK